MPQGLKWILSEIVFHFDLIILKKQSRIHKMDLVQKG